MSRVYSSLIEQFGMYFHPYLMSEIWDVYSLKKKKKEEEITIGSVHFG